MIEINGKHYCENCFEPVSGAICKRCKFNSADNAPDPTMLEPGTVLQNRYVVGRVIGKGGFGITYLAYDALVCKKVAIKEYYPYGLAQRNIGSADESSKVSVTSEDNAEAFKIGAEKFYNEAKLVARFSGNPNIVGVYDCFYENNTAYIAMEYLHGCTLKEYIREHGVLVAAFVIPLAVRVYKLPTESPNSGDPENSLSDNILTTDGNAPNLEKEGYQKTLYMSLNSEDKELYGYLYNGIRVDEKTIVLPSISYTVEQTQRVFEDMMNDNPLFCMATGINLNYNDANRNGQPDPEEYVTTVIPIYNGTNRTEMGQKAIDMLNESGYNTYQNLDGLLYMHDKLVSESKIDGSNMSPISQTAYGPIMEKTTDGLGLAKAVCCFAQLLQFNSYVMEIKNPEYPNFITYIVRVEIDGQWYSIAPFVNINASTAATLIPLDPDGTVNHYHFLVSDDILVNQSGVVPTRESFMNSELFMLETDCWNYYFEKMLNVPYYNPEFTGNIDTDGKVYNVILEETKKQVESGKKTVTIHMLPELVDDVWKHMQESYVSEMSEKHGITIGEYSAIYSNDAMIITLEL